MARNDIRICSHCGEMIEAWDKRRYARFKQVGDRWYCTLLCEVNGEHERAAQ